MEMTLNEFKKFLVGELGTNPLTGVYSLQVSHAHKLSVERLAALKLPRAEELTNGYVYWETLYSKSLNAVLDELLPGATEVQISKSNNEKVTITFTPERRAAASLGRSSSIMVSELR